METNLEQQSPKLNVTNVSSAVFGKEEGATLGKESSIGKLSRILRTTRLKVNEVEKSITGISAKFLEIEKRITLNTENITGNIEKTASNTEKIKGNIKKSETNAKKITSIKNILQNQKSNIGEKLPGSTEEKEKAKLNTTLTETNRILVEIQKQLAYDFAMRVAEDKQEVAEDKEATSKERFKREESALEKSAKSMVSTVKTATKKIVSPIGNIFEKLLAFIGILGKGILVNAAFDWFKDPENQKKITKFFNILKQNWKLLRNIFLTVVAVGAIMKVIGALAIIGKVLALLASPIILKFLAIAGTAAFLNFVAKKALTNLAGGEAFLEEHRLSEEELRSTGVDTFGDKGRIRNPNYKPAIGPGGTSSGGPQYLDVMVSGSVEQKEAFQKYQSRREEIEGLRSQRDAELKGVTDDQEKAKIEIKYEDLLQKRAMGGPVMSGNTYLVGERGPELFSPNIDGSIVNNMRTEKIYQMLASGKRGRTRIVELPPQTIEGPKPEIKMPRGPATKAPKISSSNSLDGYRSVSSGIYGIMV